jgi:hypothetical protein
MGAGINERSSDKVSIGNRCRHHQEALKPSPSSTCASLGTPALYGAVACVTASFHSEGYARQEQQVLVAVTEARAKATQMQLPANILTNPEAFR